MDAQIPVLLDIDLLAPKRCAGLIGARDEAIVTRCVGAQVPVILEHQVEPLIRGVVLVTNYQLSSTRQGQVRPRPQREGEDRGDH